MAPEQHSAVLLDRYPLWLDAVEVVLARLDVSVVGKTTSPVAALSLLETLQPDIFITEIEFSNGEIDGIDCVRDACRRQPDLHAIVLSMHTDTAFVDRALAAGAFAYVIKSAHPDDLASTIRQTFNHSVYLSGQRAVSEPPAARLEPVPDQLPKLTRREGEILRLMVEGYPNAQLAKMLWVTEQTVKFHLSNIYRKLNAANRTEAARVAHRFGLIPAGPPAVDERRPRLVAG